MKERLKNDRGICVLKVSIGLGYRSIGGAISFEQGKRMVCLTVSDRSGKEMTFHSDMLAYR